MNEAKRQELLVSTRQAAADLVEDIDHLRDVLSRDIAKRGELRRSSAILRKLLVEGGLQLVAAPRIGKELRLVMPDNKPFINKPIPYFASGGASIFGLFVRASAVNNGSKPIPIAKDYSAQSTIIVKLDTFLKQPVICLGGNWLSRQDVIKFVANKAGGVHPSTKPITEKEKLLNNVANATRIARMADGTVDLKMSMSMFDPNTKDSFPYVPSEIDAVQFELLCAVHFLLQSNSISALRNAIELELAEAFAAHPINKLSQR